MMRLVRLYEAQGQYDEMEKAIVEALEACRRIGNRQLTGYFTGKLIKRIKDISLVAIGHYDAEKCNEAYTVLIRQVELRGSLNGTDSETPPSDVALLAMSLHELGRDQEATVQLGRLRQMFAQGEHTYEEKYLCEAEKVFVDNDGGACRAWGLLEGRELEGASRIIEGLRASSGGNDPNGSIQSLTNALARMRAQALY